MTNFTQSSSCVQRHASWVQLAGDYELDKMYSKKQGGDCGRGTLYKVSVAIIVNKDKFTWVKLMKIHKY